MRFNLNAIGKAAAGILSKPPMVCKRAGAMAVAIAGLYVPPARRVANLI